MNPFLHALPYDPTGTAINNRTRGEVHDLSAQHEYPYKVIVMEKGYFYTKDLVIIDKTGYRLVENQDYQCTMMNAEIAKKTGKTACAVIVVSSKKINPVVRIDAQMVGGVYCQLAPAIAQQARGLLNNTRSVHWNNIIDKPNTFKPNGHFHALWELFRFTPQVLILKRIESILERQIERDMDDVLAEFQRKLDQIGDNLGDIDARLTTHIQDTRNPHNTTKAKLQLDKVQDGAVATLDQARTTSGTILDAYATPLRAADSIAVNFTPMLQAHITDYNNPHKETAAKLGTLTVQEHLNLAAQYYDRGSVVAMTDRLEGELFSSIYDRARKNVPINQLTSGIFPSERYSTHQTGTPMVDSLLVPTGDPNWVANDGYFMGWLGIDKIFETYEKKGNQILYMSGTVGSMSKGNNAADTITTLRNTFGYNVPSGTMAVWRYLTDWIISTGNGAYTTHLSAIGMAVFLNGDWRIPGMANGNSPW
ncbi:virion structural protein [Pseudomonas phage PhiPA3]|uniref:Virion structural protein n=1 Tax=Pseudomonas phage PhiPA3 TaxID=998086 RepID=F8SK26_BPPA3|nr:virion structural protein [Pseudomonas phage PhiPA3]AEH03576.1 virion structural protein [Pseudomonas phage PhiPA3]